MDGNFYTESYTYNEGRIFLYKRPNSKNFQCRLKVEGIRGYDITSTKTSNLGTALKYAEDRYEDLKYKKRYNLPLKTKTFRQIYNDWFARADKSKYRQDFYTSRAKLYLFPYFGDYKIEEITEDLIDNYWPWRKNYYKLHPEMINGNVAVVPSVSSLRMEKTAIKEVLEYACAKGYIRVVPQIKFKPRKATERRDEFTEEEYHKILESFSVPYNMNNKDKDIFYSEKYRADVAYQRRMIYWIIVFMANTGVRPSEVYKIKWKHIKIHNENGRNLLYVNIVENNKTGKRTVVSNPEAYECYTTLQLFSKYKKADDYLFNNYFDGSPMKNWSKTFKTELEKLNLYISENGKPRPPYSLRHYYATERLLKGVSVYDLARNMGTSVKQIEKHSGHILATQKTAELIQNSAKTSFEENVEDYATSEQEKDSLSLEMD